MAPLPSDPDPIDDLSGPALPVPDAAPSSARAVAAVGVEQPPASGVTLNPVPQALQAFLASRKKKEGREFVRSVIVRKLGPDVDEELMDDLIQLACIRALQGESPPWLVSGIPGWVRRVTRRTIADYFRSRGRKADKKYLEPGVDSAHVSDRHAPQTDWGAREYLIVKWLEGQIGDRPRDRETFELMMQHEVAKRPLAELAAERRTTEAALSNRFHKLRRKLAPRVAVMDQEKPRTVILLLLWLFGLAALFALVYLLLFRHPAPPATAVPDVVPAPSTTGSAVLPEPFDQALPPGQPERPDKPPRPTR